MTDYKVIDEQDISTERGLELEDEEGTEIFAIDVLETWDGGDARCKYDIPDEIAEQLDEYVDLRRRGHVGYLAFKEGRSEVLICHAPMDW